MAPATGAAQQGFEPQECPAVPECRCFALLSCLRQSMPAAAGSSLLTHRSSPHVKNGDGNPSITALVRRALSAVQQLLLWRSLERWGGAVAAAILGGLGAAAAGARAHAC